MHLKYISSTRIFSSRFTKIFLLFCACAFIGSSVGKSYRTTLPDRLLLLPKVPTGDSVSGRRQTSCWKCNDRRIGSVQCLFAEDTEEKKIYLTFDAGFENGNTPAILDALKNIRHLLHFLWLEISFRKTKI